MVHRPCPVARGQVLDLRVGADHDHRSQIAFEDRIQGVQKHGPDEFSTITGAA